MTDLKFEVEMMCLIKDQEKEIERLKKALEVCKRQRKNYFNIALKANLEEHWRPEDMDDEIDAILNP